MKFFPFESKMKHVAPKLFCSVALGAALYLAVSCPCDTYLKCHRGKYLALLGMAAGFAFADIDAPPLRGPA